MAPPTPLPADAPERRHGSHAGYVLVRALGYGLIWLGWLLFAAGVIGVTLARYL
jgi:hypothetical protein